MKVTESGECIAVGGFQKGEPWSASLIGVGATAKAQTQVPVSEGREDWCFQGDHQIPKKKWLSDGS